MENNHIRTTNNISVVRGNWLKQLFCHHDYEIIPITNYDDSFKDYPIYVSVFSRCKKCGKIKHEITPVNLNYS